MGVLILFLEMVMILYLFHHNLFHIIAVPIKLLRSIHVYRSNIHFNSFIIFHNINIEQI